MRKPRRRRDRAYEKLGQTSPVPRRPPACQPLPHERPAPDLHGADPVFHRLQTRRAGAHVHRIPLPRAGRRRRHHHAARPPVGARIRGPFEIPRGRGWGQFTGGRTHRHTHRRQDGRRRVDEHPLPRRPQPIRRPPPFRALLGDATRRGCGRHRHGARAHDPALERMADRLGLRHQPAAPGGGRSLCHRRRAPAGRRSGTGDRTDLGQHMDGQRRLRHPYAKRPRVHHGRRRPQAPALERAGVKHVHSGRLQSGMETGRGDQGAGGRGLAGHLHHRTRAHRQTDRDPRQPVHRRIRPHIRGARHDRRHRYRAHSGQHGRPLRRLPRG